MATLKINGVALSTTEAIVLGTAGSVNEIRAKIVDSANNIIQINKLGSNYPLTHTVNSTDATTALHSGNSTLTGKRNIFAQYDLNQLDINNSKVFSSYNVKGTALFKKEVVVLKVKSAADTNYYTAFITPSMANGTSISLRSDCVVTVRTDSTINKKLGTVDGVVITVDLSAKNVTMDKTNYRVGSDSSTFTVMTPAQMATL